MARLFRSIAYGTAALACASAGAAAQTSSFRFEVLPILERSGCAAAACHGGATGRGGFKLSLFGSEPASDWRAITEQHFGRRVDVANPEASLLLRKATKRYDHGGGRVLRADESAYETILQWIRDGAPSDLEAAPAIAALRLELEGSRVRSFVRKVGAEDDVCVDDFAHYWASDPAALRVDEDGTFEIRAPGEHWIYARYAGATARVRVLRPFTAPTSAPGVRAAAADASSDSAATCAQEIDALWRAQLARLGLVAGPAATRATIARRLSIDLADRTPTAAERRGTQDSGAHDLGVLVDRLCDAARFREVIGAMLESTFELEDDEGLAQIARQTSRQLREVLAAELPKLRTVGDLVRGLLEPGPMRRVLTRHADPRDRAEFYGRSLLGVRIGCARCHDHPSDRWRRNEHLEFSACFVDAGSGSGRLYDEDGRVVEPRLLPLRPGNSDVEATVTPREIREFTLDDAAELAARAWCHRVFVRLFGRTLYAPVDDQRLTNPVLHEAVLDRLARDMIDNDMRLDRPFRVLARTQLYGLASADEKSAAIAVRHLAARPVRVLGPARRLVVAAGALGVPARPARLSPSPVRSELELRHGPQFRTLLDEAGGYVDLLALTTQPRARLDEIWLHFLGRPPRPRERELFESSARTGDRGVLRDLVFAVLSSAEFSVLR